MLILSSRPRYVHAYAGMDAWSIISSSNFNNEFLASCAVNFQTYRFISLSRFRFSQDGVYLGCVYEAAEFRIKYVHVGTGARSIILSSTQYLPVLSNSYYDRLYCSSLDLSWIKKVFYVQYVLTGPYLPMIKDYAACMHVPVPVVSRTGTTWGRIFAIRQAPLSFLRPWRNWGKSPSSSLHIGPALQIRPQTQMDRFSMALQVTHEGKASFFFNGWKGEDHDCKFPWLYPGKKHEKVQRLQFEISEAVG